MTGENWNTVMYAGMRSGGGDLRVDLVDGTFQLLGSGDVVVCFQVGFHL